MEQVMKGEPALRPTRPDEKMSLSESAQFFFKRGMGVSLLMIPIIAEERDGSLHIVGVNMTLDITGSGEHRATIDARWKQALQDPEMGVAGDIINTIAELNAFILEEKHLGMMSAPPERLDIRGINFSKEEGSSLIAISESLVEQLDQASKVMGIAPLDIIERAVTCFTVGALGVQEKPSKP